MILSNFHTHSQYCDGQDILENFVKKAIEFKFDVLGFSSHAPVPFEANSHMKSENLDKYINEINILKEKYAGKIEIYCGMEIDYIENVCGVNSFKNYPLDYTIGSVHYFINNITKLNVSIDYTPENFRKFSDNNFGNNFPEFVKKYFDKINKMVIENPPNIVGHLDIIAKFNKNSKFFDESETWYLDIVDETLEIIKNSDCIIEINTRRYYQKFDNCFYPNYFILKKIRDKKIPVMINSDAHQPNQIISGIVEARKALIELGFNEVRVLINKKWQNLPLE